MPQTNFILPADDPLAGFFERRQLFLGRTLPQPNVGVDACLAVAFGIQWILQHTAMGKKLELAQSPFVHGIAGFSAVATDWAVATVAPVKKAPTSDEQSNRFNRQRQSPMTEGSWTFMPALCLSPCHGANKPRFARN
jgi:hypothetical protein